MRSDSFVDTCDYAQKLFMDPVASAVVAVVAPAAAAVDAVPARGLEISKCFGSMCVELLYEENTD